MSLLLDMLDFTLNDYSLRAVSQEAGIPYSSLYRFSTGEADLPGKYNSALTNFYRRTAYQDLKDIGLSATQANRFRSYAPSTVLEVISETRATIDNLTIQAMIRESELKGVEFNSSEIQDMYDDIFSAIQVNFGKSVKSTEELWTSG